MRALQYLAILMIAIITFPATAKVAHHRGVLAAAADRVDVDYISLLTVAHFESRGDAKAQNKRSSAGGLMGFTDRTWRAYIKRHGKQYGFDHRTSKYNPRANALMAAHYMKDNERVLRKVLKRQPVPGELYMAHLLGLGGAIKVFKAPGHRTAAYLLPTSAKGNKRYFYQNDGRGKPRTVQQFRDYMNWRFTSIGEQYAKQFDIGEDLMVARL